MSQPVLLSKIVAGATQTAAVSRCLSSPNCLPENSCFAEVSSLNVSSSFQILRFQRKRSRNKHNICSKEFCRQTGFRPCPYVIGLIKKKKFWKNFKKVLFWLHIKKKISLRTPIVRRCQTYARPIGGGITSNCEDIVTKKRRTLTVAQPKVEYKVNKIREKATWRVLCSA